MGNQEKIDLSKGMEWYWLYQAIYDAGMFETCNNRIHKGDGSLCVLFI